MKCFKKISVYSLLALSVVGLTGCGTKDKEENKPQEEPQVNPGKPESNLNVTLASPLKDIMSKLYEGIPEDEIPMMLESMDITSENKEQFFGEGTKVEYKEAIASESMTGSVAYSVMLVRSNDGANMEEVKAQIKEKLDPRKWICVEVPEEDVIIESKEDLAIVIMVADENARNKIHKAWKNL